MLKNVRLRTASFSRATAPALLLAALLPWQQSTAQTQIQTQTALQKPPVAPVHDVSDTYYGQTVVDPYRWLENLQSPEVKNWMRSQADYTRSVLDSMPGRKQFAAEMEGYLNAPEADISDVQVAGEFIFYRKRLRGENQENLYVRKAAGGPERMLLNVSKLSTPGHHISLDQYGTSNDGRYVIVGLSAGGSEIQTAHIYESASGRELPEQLERFEGGVFSPDCKTLYYLQLEKLAPNAPAINKFRRPTEYSHIIGTQMNDDTPVLGQGISPDIAVADYNFPIAFPVAGSPFALAQVAPGVEPFHAVYIGDPSALTTHKGWRKVADLKDKITDAILQGNDLYLVSFDGAMNGKLLRVDAANPDLTKAEVIVPSSDLVFSGGFIGSDVLHQASDALYLRVIKNGYGQVLRVPYGSGAKFTTLNLPAGEQVTAAATNQTVSGAVLSLASWTDPGDYYLYNPKSNTTAAMRLQPPNNIDPTNLTSEEVEANAADGTLIPLSIIYKKGLVRDGSAPTALIGYGAYGDAWMPDYSRRSMAWLEARWSARRGTRSRRRRVR